MKVVEKDSSWPSQSQYDVGVNQGEEVPTEEDRNRSHMQRKILSAFTVTNLDTTRISVKN